MGKINLDRNKKTNMNTDMKTRLDYLKTLRSPYREQAIRNAYARCAERVLGEHDNLQAPDATECNSLSEAINYSFVWSRTPEGGEYWADVYGKPEEYAAKPLPESFRLPSGDYTVDFKDDGSIAVGCQTIPLDALREIVKRAESTVS